MIDCRQGIPRRQRHQLIASADKGRIGTDEQRLNPMLRKACEARIDLRVRSSHIQ